MAYALLAVAALLAEIASIVLVGSYLGVAATLALMAAAMLLGTAVLAGRGVITITRGLDTLSQRQPVAPVVIDGALVAFAGVLLIVPGFASDVVGLLLLIPWVRAGTRDRLLARFHVQELGGEPGERGPGGDVIIDTTGVEVQSDDSEAPPLSTPPPRLPS
ncbi:MAG TPA: FxsA family protein [Kofleriaceae bacterium]|jgi:UPF0716 protein FxsA|nr:FxsA family protein [Kofleriaceae bacterium]